MKFKVTVESGLWANCEEFPHEWQPDKHSRYSGYVESLERAMFLVMKGIGTWYKKFTVTTGDSREPRIWEFSTVFEDHTGDARFLASIEIEN